MGNLGRELTGFVVGVGFDDLPAEVVHEAKRSLLDSFGCALGGLSSDKGRIAVEFARRFGGAAASSIAGVREKVAPAAAAFANGELINSQDYDSILSPPGHVSPYVVPAAAAVAESVGARGRDLIVATALAHEISVRLSRALSPMYEITDGASGGKVVTWPPVFSFNQCIFGAVAGAGKILSLDPARMVSALGIAGHNCPVSGMRKFMESQPAAMTKYGSAGWVSSAAVTATLLAQLGYVGDDTVFEGDYGFWRFFGSEKWEPGVVLDGIGTTWHFLAIQYKPYPCCRCMHSALDHFIEIIDEHHLGPDDIEGVEVYGHALEDKPNWQNEHLASHIDAQFNVPYAFAAAVYRMDVGQWQTPGAMTDPRLVAFMKRVHHQVHPRFAAEKARDARSNLGSVEVRARGKVFRGESVYARGVSQGDATWTDEDLARKFRANAAPVLPKDKVEAAIGSFLKLEEVADTRTVWAQLTT